MCKKVEKRDGRIVEFDHSRIFMALQAAFKAAKLPCNYTFVCRTSTKISEDTRDLLTVEDIQDLIVSDLKEQFPDVAIVYKEYRHKRDMARRSKVNKTLRDIVNAKATDITTENGNMNADTPSGMMYKFASESSKEFAFDELLDPRFAESHKCGDIHIHDLDYYPTRSLTCVQHPLNRVLSDGFPAGHGESRPSKRIEKIGRASCRERVSSPV